MLLLTYLLPLDLHVLSLPLAFILSQDQTLHCIYFYFKCLSLPCNSFLYFQRNLRSNIQNLHFRVLVHYHIFYKICCLSFIIISINLSVLAERECKGRNYFLIRKFFVKNFNIFLKLFLPHTRKIHTKP